MNLDELKKASCYEELELLMTLQGLQGNRRDVFEELLNYQDDTAFCIPTASGFVWYSKSSLKRIEVPKKISRSFCCSYNSLIVSLEGAPVEVGGGLYCHDCPSLKSLEGATEKVGGNFSCSFCSSLTSLEGAPIEVNKNFYCSECASLTSLVGVPDKVGGSFYCANCKSLTSLEIEKLKKTKAYSVVSRLDHF